MTHAFCPHFFLFLFLALASSNAARWKTFDYSVIEKELKDGRADYVELKQVSDTPITYRAWGVWSFPHPVKEVAAVALDLDNYTKIFSYVYRCSRITEPSNRVSSLGTWYVEGRAAIASVWSIGNIDTLMWTDSLHLRLIAHQNMDPYLERKWATQEKGWLNFRTHSVRLAAFVVAAGADSCRIGMMVQGLVGEKMPSWLVILAREVVLPTLLKDVEKEVARRAAEKIPKQPTWYERWYQTLQKFLF